MFKHLSCRGVAVVALLLLTSKALAEAPDADAAVQAALAADPGIAELEVERALAMGQVVDHRFLRINPELEVRHALAGTLTEASLTQPISLSGEGIHGARAAQARVEAAEARLMRARLALAARTRQALAGAVYAHGKAQFASESLLLATDLRRTVEARFEAGETSMLDLRLARLEEAEAVAAALESDREESEALQLFFALAPGFEADIEWPIDPAGVVAPVIDGDDIDERGDVAAAAADLRAATADLHQNRAAVLAPVAFGVFVERDEGGVAVGPTLSIELPLWNHNRGGVRSAQAKIELAQLQQERVVRGLQTELRTTAATLERAEATAQTTGADLTGDARIALEGLESGYQEGEWDLPTVLMLRTSIIEGQVAALQARLLLAQARIDYLLARDSRLLLVNTQEASR